MSLNVLDIGVSNTFSSTRWLLINIFISREKKTCFQNVHRLIKKQGQTQSWIYETGAHFRDAYANNVNWGNKVMVMTREAVILLLSYTLFLLVIFVFFLVIKTSTFIELRMIRGKNIQLKWKKKLVKNVKSHGNWKCYSCKNTIN